eukprot:6071344-Prymnesium_polylepis.1
MAQPLSSLSCLACGGTTNLQACACKQAVFCNTQCQRRAWSTHKELCKSVRAAQASAAATAAQASAVPWHELDDNARDTLASAWRRNTSAHALPATLVRATTIRVLRCVGDGAE